MGCSKNLVDSEQLMRQFKANGYQVEHDPHKINGEIVVVNTCGFIGDAQEESIEMILELGEAKKQGRIGKLFVMGCLSERFMNDLVQELPEVDHFYGKFNWKELISDLGKAYHEELAHDRVLTTPKHYAYLKIGEGCNRTCSYCSIPLITGAYQSRPMEDLVEEVKLLVGRGVKEFQLIAQDLTYYGLDLYKRMALPELVERISDVKGVEWIRLHYGYPAHFPLDLLRVMRERENVCKYMDIALQHISDNMLKLMRRNITKAQTYELMQRMREEVPGIHLRTTLMVGHPGETEAEAMETVDLVRQVEFDALFTFIFSPRPGTPAAKMDDPVPRAEKQKWFDTLCAVQNEISARLHACYVGKTLRCLVDGETDDARWPLSARTAGGRLVHLVGDKSALGQYRDIKITDSNTWALFGEMV